MAKISAATNHPSSLLASTLGHCWIIGEPIPLLTSGDQHAATTPNGESKMDEKKEQPEENSQLYVLQLVTGTGKVLWQQSLSLLCPQMAPVESVSWNEEKSAGYYSLRVGLDIPTSPDSSS